MCANKAKKEHKHKKINNENSVPGTSSNGSQVTAAVAEFTAMPPPLSHHSKRQQLEQAAPAAATASVLVFFNFGTCFAFFSSWAVAAAALRVRRHRAGALHSEHARRPTL